MLPALLWSRGAHATIAAAAAPILDLSSARALLLSPSMMNLPDRHQMLFPFARPRPTRIGLIACSAIKLEHAAPARELYQGPIFKLARAWMERRADAFDTWAILSANYGLLMPDDVVEPYDVALSSLPIEERRAWAERTRRQIIHRWGCERIFTVIAGAEYREALGPSGFLKVEDVIGTWARWRYDEGLRPAHVSIGLLRKYLANDCSPGAGCR